MNKKGSKLIVLGLVAIIAAGALTAYNIFDAKRAEMSAALAYEQMMQYITEMENENASYENKEAFTPDYILYPEMEMPEKEIEGLSYIGVLEIPALKLSLPVLSEWSTRLLKVSPCRYEGSAYQDSLIIAAHNYTSHFANIKNLYPDDEIIFRDNAGNIFRYNVVLLESLESTDVEEMKGGEWDLTLFTCTPGGQYRVTVRCERAK